MNCLLDVGKGHGKPGGFPPVSPRRPCRPARHGRRGVPQEEGGSRGKHGFPRGSEAKPSDVEQAMRIVAGTARSMGVEVEA